MTIIQVLNNLSLFQADELVYMLQGSELIYVGTWEIRMGGFNNTVIEKCCIQTLENTFYQYFV